VNRRILGLVGALLLAAVGTVMIAAYVKDADARALDGQKTVDVLVVKKSVPAGTPAEDLGERVAVESMLKQAVVDGALVDVDDVKGKVTGAALIPGEQLARARFVDASAFRATGSSVEVPDGLLQTTVKLDPERAVGGVLTPGSHVAVTASFDDKANWPPASTQVLLHDVLVTNVQMTQSTDGKAFTTKAATSDDSDIAPGNAPTGQLLVTLALDVPSVERVVFAAERGSLWLSIEPDDASPAGSKNVTRSNVQ
jgi:pilus assembly protein CpaB